MKNSKSLSYQAGIAAPLVVLGVFVVLDGLYYLWHENTAQLPPSPENEVNVISGTTSSESSPAPTPTPATTQTAASLTADLYSGVPTGPGVMPQKLGWHTYTNTDFSYAVSYPTDWFSTGDSKNLVLSDGRALITITSANIPSGLSVADFASQNGVTSGFVTSQVNAYNALESFVGGATNYFIVNGAVGYKISVSGDLAGAEGETVRAILIEFTVTRQR